MQFHQTRWHRRQPIASEASSETVLLPYAPSKTSTYIFYPQADGIGGEFGDSTTTARTVKTHISFYNGTQNKKSVSSRYALFQRVKEPSLTRWRGSKKEVAFRRGGLVGVRGYGRGRIGEKQRKALQCKASRLFVFLVTRNSKVYLSLLCRTNFLFYFVVSLW